MWYRQGNYMKDEQLSFEKIKKLGIVPIKDKENPLSYLKSIRLKTVLENYYTDKVAVKEIIRKYDLPIDNVMDFHRYLPYYYTKVMCPYDGTKMCAAMPSRSNFKGHSPNVFCLECEHKKGTVCNCVNCQKESNREKEKIIAILDGIYKNSEIRIEDIGFIDRINIATLLQLSGNEYGYLILPFKQYSRSATGSITDEILTGLIQKKILRVSDQNDTEIFSNLKKDSLSYELNKSYLALNISSDLFDDKRNLFQELKNPKKLVVNSFQEYRKIWQHYVFAELHKLFIFQMSQFRIDKELDSINKKQQIYAAFDRWMEAYTPSQIYAIIYKSVRDVDNIRTLGKMGNYKFHEMKFVIKIADRMIVKYEKENWGIQHYDFPTSIEINLQTQIFFNTIVHEPNWFDSNLPGLNQNEVFVDNDIHYLKETECQHVDGFVHSTIDESIYYYIFTHGIVINDGNVEVLFTTKESLISYKNILNQKGLLSENVKNMDVFSQICYASVEGFYIQDCYCSNVIFQIITILLENKVPTKEEWKLNQSNNQ